MSYPMAEYFPHPDEGGVLDDGTPFYELFEGEPRANSGHITLSDAPGLGVTLSQASVDEWRLNL